MYVPVCSGALGETLEQGEIDLDIEHSLTGEKNTSGVSLLDTDAQLQPDILEQYIDMDGLYYGNMIPASTINLGVNQKAQIITWLSLEPNIIASGCSDYWLRIPLDGTTIDSIELSIDYFYPFGNNLYSAPLYNIGDFSRLKWTEDGILININHFILSTTYKIWMDAPIPWGNSTPSYLPKADYIGKNRYDFRFAVENIIPKRGSSIRMLVTEENYTLEENVTMDIGATEIEKNLYGLHLAWGFVFLAGCPANTLYTIDSGTSVFGVRFSAPTSYPFTNGDYVTAMLPYYGQNIDWEVYVYINYSIGGDNNTKGWDWTDSLYLLSTPTTLWYGFEKIMTASEIHTEIENIEQITANYTLSFTDKTNLLAFTIPTQVNSWDDLSIIFVPSEPVRFFCAGTTWKGMEFHNWPSYIYPDTTFIDSGYGIVNSFKSNIFIDFQATTGLLAELNYTSEYTIYDFGYCKGYQYPGRVDIWVELNNQTQIYFDGNIGELYEKTLSMKEGIISTTPNITGIDPVQDFLDELYYQIILAVQTATKTITGVIETVFSQITGFLNWIKQALIEIIGTIKAWIESFLQYIGNIIKGVFLVAPLWVVLMVAKSTVSPSETLSDIKQGVVEVKKEMKYNRYSRRIDEKRKQRYNKKREAYERKTERLNRKTGGNT